MPNERVLEHELEQPAFRDLWERTALARAIALSVTPPSRKSSFPAADISTRKGGVVQEGEMSNGSKVLAAAS
ncbi:MAG: hypothetical protein DLM70_07400 [Chloroflexi bacterium]|nr:MAG: hypothetical protein DLM70_07400 [Chloroflexota bacterium]